MPIVAAGTVYVGSLVACGQGALDEGVKVFPDASGVDDVDNQNMPFGVIIGSNRKNKVWDNTERLEIGLAPAAAEPHDGASIEYVGAEGPWSKGDPQIMVKVAIITPSTILKAPLHATSASESIALLTATAGNTSGVQVVTNAADFTNVANLGTIYCRSGNNAGAYRICTDASDVTHTWDLAMKADTVIGDTFVKAGMRPYGHSTVMFDNTTAAWIDVDDAPAANGNNRHAISVVRLDLREAGKEFVEFMFDISKFGAYITTA